MYTFSEISEKIYLNRLHFTLKLLKKIRITESNIVLLLAILVGLGAGLASVFFRYVLHNMHHFFFGIVYPWLSEYSIYTLPLIPMFGAIMLIPFSKLYPGEINGYGMPKFLIKVHLKGGLIKTRTILVKIITSAITISTGGSAGVEGPIAQIGGTIGSSIGRFFETSTKRLQVLIACGSAGGIAAQFNAPLAGVLFAQEIIMVGEFQLETFGVIVIASGLATAVSRAFYSSAPTFGSLSYSINGIYEFIFYIILGILIGFLAWIFIKIFFGINDRFQKLNINAQLKPILGAFLIGLMGLIHLGAMGDGYEYIIASLESPIGLSMGILALLLVLKMVGTAITLGSGNVGGVFAPALFIGAMTGGLFGKILQVLFPTLNIQAGSYAVVGMGAFLAASTHAPMTAIFLLFELTNNYQVIIPIMFASVLGVMVARHFDEDSLDSMELSRQGIHLHEGKEKSIMNSIKVNDVMMGDYEWIPESMSFSAFMQQLPVSRVQYYPVLNANNELTGIVSFQNIREIILEEGLEDLIVMKELMETDLLTLTPKDTLTTALEKFAVKDIEMMPVVNETNPRQLVGMLKRKDVIVAYNKAVLLRDMEERQV